MCCAVSVDWADINWIFGGWQNRARPLDRFRSKFDSSENIRVGDEIFRFRRNLFTYFSVYFRRVIRIFQNTYNSSIFFKYSSCATLSPLRLIDKIHELQY